MSKRKARLLVTTSMLAVLLAALILSGCSSAATASRSQGTPAPVASSPSEPSNAPVQSSAGGSVTIEAKLLGHQKDSLAFEISMDTHSVNLDTYDFKQLALLRDGKGSEFSPIEWSSAPGGHHRSGKLVFAHPDQSAKTFELVIRNVAGVSERVLRWQV